MNKYGFSILMNLFLEYNFYSPVKELKLLGYWQHCDLRIFDGSHELVFFSLVHLDGHDLPDENDYGS